jgi:hypothetical protein
METAVLERCACGAPASANGTECPACYRERLGSVNSGFTPTRSRGQIDPAKSRRWDGRLEDYRRTRAEGIQPRSTRQGDIDAAKRLSDRIQEPFRADAAVRGTR